MSQQPPRQPGDLRPITLETLPAAASNRSGGQAGSESVGAPAVLIIGFGYQMVDATHSARLRFEIPQQMMWVRRVRLSFSLLPFRSGIQSTSSAAGAHDHEMFHSTGSTATFGGASVWEAAALAKNSAGATATLYIDSQTLSNPGGDGSFHTYTSATPHTHTLNNPSSLFETGTAQNSTIAIDGTDRTALLGGPWGVGVNPTDVSDLDLSKIQTAGLQSIWERGFHEIDIGSTTIGGVAAQVLLIGTINAT